MLRSGWTVVRELAEEVRPGQDGTDSNVRGLQVIGYWFTQIEPENSPGSPQWPAVGKSSRLREDSFYPKAE